MQSSTCTVLLFVSLHVSCFLGNRASPEPRRVLGSLLCRHSSKCQQDGSHVSSNITLPCPVLPGRPPDGSRCDVVLGRGSGAAKTDETGSKRPLSPTCQALIEMDGGGAHRKRHMRRLLMKVWKEMSSGLILNSPVAPQSHPLAPGPEPARPLRRADDGTYE